jgi:hypothetical protein
MSGDAVGNPVHCSARAFFSGTSKLISGRIDANHKYSQTGWAWAICTRWPSM